MRRIVFAGNCQLVPLHNAYEKHIAPETNDRSTYIDSMDELSDASRRAIEEADVLVEQLFDFTEAGLADIPSAAKRYSIPLVTANFLWPFAREPHLSNVPLAGTMENGPYPAELGDSYLNQMIRTGVGTDQAIEQYLNLDMNSVVNLDRLYDFVIKRQRRRDEATGYRFADLIEKYFRTEQIFLTPYHPNLRIASYLMTEFFQRFGVAPTLVDRVARSLTRTPFPLDELPIHPSVCRHFGLTFIDETCRYRYSDEGRFTFEEFARRYMDFHWNRELQEGITLSRAGQDGSASDKLRAGLARSPESAAGWLEMSRIHDRLGAMDAAISAAARSAGIETADGYSHAQLGSLLARTGQLAEAEPALRKALEMEPFQPHFQAELGNLLMAKGELAEAEMAFRQAIHLQPGNAHFHIALSHSLIRAGRIDEAVAAARQAIELEPSQPHFRGYLGDLLARQGELSEAEISLRKAIEIAPGNPHFHFALSHLMIRSDRIAEAIAAAEASVRLSPAEPTFSAHLSSLRAGARNTDAPEPAA